ncbi:gamma-tubulin complex component 3 isoform X2 [Scaptodrosophila lebanonensis]|uniref:Gamma-tubulin complex component 3 isoform X2 n=1 Tax=Drosophila lebanonensis TaxID=7225 RepID=A0A6J2UGU7_DROLE|nr:gamma-tubulin complex component 3 isoform X2 [Scaptodrosophila lebanonensis]
MSQHRRQFRGGVEGSAIAAAAAVCSNDDETGAKIISKKIMNLLRELCEHIKGSGQDELRRIQYVAHAAQYISKSPNAFENLPVLSEQECLQKIMDTLNSKAHTQDAQKPGDLFYKVYKRLSDEQIDTRKRQNLLNFLLCIADGDSAPVLSSSRAPAGTCSVRGAVTEERPSTESLQKEFNTRYHSLSSCNVPGILVQTQLAKLALKSNGLNNNLILNANSNTSINTNNSQLSTFTTNGNMPPEINGKGPGGQIYSYDASQAGMGLSKQGVPNYMEVLKKQKDFEAEHDLAQNAVFAFIGIQGRYLKKDVISGRFKLNPLHQKALTASQSSMLLRLAELGYYYDRVVQFANTATGYNAMGCMGQSLISKLNDELTLFHGKVARLQDEMNQFRAVQMRDYISRDKTWLNRRRDDITLVRLMGWYGVHLKRMQWLSKIADACQMRKGGELASVVYDFLGHGGDEVDVVAVEVLAAICKPLVRMISNWMLEGNIDDTYGEFFVESLPEVGADRLWHDKFRLRHNMLPKFFSLDIADKILKTGKSINFLREICEMQELVKGREKLKEIMENNAADIFSYAQDTRWHAAMETCYQQTSKHVLDMMVGPHKLLDHLHGMRRYLLLGQGDFVGILIENMKEELEKKGSEIYSHDLSAMLDAALRCTNAQYDDPEVLNHLDIVVKTPYPGDCGWDVISLQYTVQGPLATMLEPTMSTYKILFKPLWRMKHMEFLLSMKIWKEQMGNAKALRSMKGEIAKASYGLHLFTSEIMHFVHQMQYYVLFEVIECNWVDLQKQMQKATALDDILDAHEKFLRTITVGCFIKTMTDMERNLEMVYGNIISLENWQSHFYEECFKELHAREVHAKRIADSERAGRFGVTAEQQMDRDQGYKNFQQKVNSACRNLETIASSYEKAVRGFLLALNSSNDPNLQLFGTRLDFNEYYKKRDTSLSVPLTFEHMRMSVASTTRGYKTLPPKSAQAQSETQSQSNKHLIVD